jgi:hypothetical protein
MRCCSALRNNNWKTNTNIVIENYVYIKYLRQKVRIENCNVYAFGIFFLFLLTKKKKTVITYLFIA